MVALLVPSLFEDSETPASRLVSLFDMALTGRHLVLPEPLEHPSVEAWLGERDPRMREDIRKAIGISLEADNLYPPSLSILIVPDRELGEPHWSETPKLPLTQARRFLERPLRVLVENKRRDPALLLCLASPGQRHELQKAIDGNSLEFEQAGGIDEMRMILENRSSNKQACLRSWLVFDSDALAPGLPSRSSKRLKKKCEQLGVGHHRLQRRAAENYLPPEALTDWARHHPKRKPKARAFDRLNAEQRHHFNMKSGLSGDAEQLKLADESSRSAVRALYDPLPAADRESLSQGFGSLIADLFRDDTLIRRRSLFANDGSLGEMRPVVDAILNAC